jgi:hypothetical protein
VAKIVALAIWLAIATPWQTPTDTSPGVTTTASTASTSSTSSVGSPSTTQGTGSEDKPTGFAPIATILAALIGAGGTFLVMHVKNRYDKEATKRTEDREDLISRHDKQQERLAARHTEERSRQERRDTAERTEVREEHKTERTERREEHELKRTEQESQRISEQDKLSKRHEEEQTSLLSRHMATFSAIDAKHAATINPLQNALRERQAIQVRGAEVIKLLPTLWAVIKSEGSPKEVPGRPQLQALQDTSESLSPGSLQSALQDVISVLAVYESSNLEPNQWARLVRRLPEILSHLERSLVEFLEKNTSECNSLKVRLAELRTRGKKRERAISGS